MINTTTQRRLLYSPGVLFIVAGALCVAIAQSLPLVGQAYSNEYRFELSIAGVGALIVGLIFLTFVHLDMGNSKKVRGRVIAKFYDDETPLITVMPDSNRLSDLCDFAVSANDYARLTYGNKVAVAYSPFLRLVHRVEIVA